MGFILCVLLQQELGSDALLCSLVSLLSQSAVHKSGLWLHQEQAMNGSIASKEVGPRVLENKQ